MNCYDVREKIEPYLDLGLSDPEAQSLKKHLEQCPECQQEVETIRKIDSFVKMDLFEPPPREYWDEVPARVTEQLGLRPKKPRFLEVFDSIREMLVFPSIRWSGALAVAGLAIFVLLRGVDTQEVASVSDPISSERTEDNSFRSENSTPDESTQLSAPSERVAAAPESGSGESAADRKTLNRVGPQVVVNASRRVPPMPVEVEMGPDRVQSFDSEQAILARAVVVKAEPKAVISGSLEFDRALFPDAGTSFRFGLMQSDEVAEDEDKETNARTFTFVRGGRGSASRRNQSVSLADTDRAYQRDDSGASDFFQTLLIVEDTKKLSERRNIWLSYVSRENNSTYRSLGIYRLADICYRIADESREEELATKALKFYVKYEKTLKSLMGVQAYDTKVAHIQGLIDTN
jgi:hypothetical protein